MEIVDSLITTWSALPPLGEMVTFTVEATLHKLGVAWNALPYVLGGVVYTVFTVLGAMVLGFIFGVPLAVVHVYGPAWARMAVRVYVWFFRGVPILLLLFLFYFGVFKALGYDPGPITACAIILGLTSAAYQSQIFRGSIESLPQGQMKAARALGMSETQGIATVVLPQALRLSIPGWSNEYSILLKDSALCFALGAPDVMARAGAVASRTYEHMTMYVVVALVYFLITLVGVRFLRGLEHRVHIPGYATAGMS